jgi:hypothetical protein
VPSRRSPKQHRADSALSHTTLPPTAAWLAAGLLLTAALLALAPHTVSDHDALLRLATGRLLTERGLSLPASDPFTFAAPEVPFGDPEWLGDLLLYGVYSAGGAGALQGFVLLLAASGYALALLLGARFGARPGVLAGLLAITLPAVAPRVAARNDIHMLWIVPLFAWLCARGTRRGWIALVPLAWLWANLHASFLLGLPLLAAGLLDALRPRALAGQRAGAASEPRDPARDGVAETAARGAATKNRDAAPQVRAAGATRLLAWGALALYPALPFLGLAGASTYRQLIDHALGAPVYRALISEWQSPLSSGGLLAILPLHVLALAGAAAVWRERRSLSWLRLTMIVGGLALAYGSRRFLLLMAALVAPALAAALSGMAARLQPRAQRTLRVLAAVGAALYLGLALRAGARLPDPIVWGRLDSAERAASFIAEHAPSGARVANTFNDGPWLAWLSAPRVQHYLDPRNNLGAGVLDRYVHEILPDPARFRGEVQVRGISLVLLRTRDPRLQPLAAALSGAQEWPLLYWDGFHALHARELAQNRALIDRFAYRILLPRFELSYLDRAAADPQLERELSRLERDSSATATALRAYLALRRGDAAGAARSFESAAGDLPQAPELLRYWTESVRRAQSSGPAP